MHRRYRLLALCLSIAIGFNSVNIYASEVSGNSLDATEDIVQEQNCDDNCTKHGHVVGESDIIDGSDIGHDILGGETSNVVSEVINIGSDGTASVTIDESGVTEDLVDVPEVEVNNVTGDVTNTVSDNSNTVSDNSNIVEDDSEKTDLTTETESDTSADDTVVEKKEETKKDSEDTVSGNDTVSDNNLTTNDDDTVSGNDITVSGNDLTVSGNDISVSDNNLEVESYKVTFIGFDGVKIGTFNTNEKTGDSDELVYPEAPVVDGYKFTGWDSDIKLISEIKEDLVITAKYVKISDLLKLNLVEGKEIFKSVNGREVKVTGTLPDNAELSVTEVTDTSYIENNIINSISKSESGITFETVLSDVVSFDIKIIVEGVEFQPEQFGESVTVTISNISDSGLRLFHDDGNGVEEIGVTIEDSAIFVAESFSTYTFANVTSGIMDVKVGGPKVSGYDCDSYVYGDKWFDNNVVRSIQDAYVFGNHLYFNSIEASDNNLNIAYVLNGDNIVEVIGIKSTLTQDLISTHYRDSDYVSTSNKVWTNTKWRASKHGINDREIFNIAYLKKFNGVIPIDNLGLVFSDGYLSGDTIKSVTWRTEKITFKDYTSTYSLIPVSDSAPENDSIIPDFVDDTNNYYWFLIKNQDGTIISNTGLLRLYYTDNYENIATKFKFKLNGVEIINKRYSNEFFKSIARTPLFRIWTDKNIKPKFTYGYMLDESKYTGVAPMNQVWFAKEILMNNYDDTYENITPSTLTLDVTLGDVFSGSVEFSGVGQNMNIMKDDTKITFKDDLYLDLTALDNNTVSLSLSSNLNKSKLMDFGGGTEYENYMNNKDSKDSIQYRFVDSDTKGYSGSIIKENIKLVYYDSVTDEKVLIDNTGRISGFVANNVLMSKDMKYFTPLFTCTTLSSDDVDKIKSALEFDNDSKKLYYTCNFHGVFDRLYGGYLNITDVSQTINSVTRDYNEIDLFIVKEIKAKPSKSKKILTFSDLIVYTGNRYGVNYEQLDIDNSSWGNKLPVRYYPYYNPNDVDKPDYRYSSEVDIKIDQNMLKSKITELGGTISSSKLDVTSVDILILNESGFPENYRTIDASNIEFKMERFSRLNGLGDGTWSNPHMNETNIHDKIGDLTSMFAYIGGFDEHIIGNRLLHGDIKLVVNTEFTLTSSNGGVYKETDSFIISQKCYGSGDSPTRICYKIIEKNKKQLYGVDVSEYILYFPYSGKFNIIGKLESCRITRLERNADGSFDDGDIFKSYHSGDSNESLQITAGYYKFEPNYSNRDCIIFEDVGYAGGGSVKFCQGYGSTIVAFCGYCNQLINSDTHDVTSYENHTPRMSKLDYVYADLANVYNTGTSSDFRYPVGWIESESNSEFVTIRHAIGYGTTVLNGSAPSGTFVFNALSDMSDYKIKITDIYSNDIPTDCVYVNGVNQTGFSNGVEKAISVRKGHNYITVDLNKGSNVGKVSDYKLVVEFMKGDTKSCLSNEGGTNSDENQHLYECSDCGSIKFKEEELNEVTLSPKSTSLVYGKIKEGGVNSNLFETYLGHDGEIVVEPSDKILNMSQQSSQQYSFTIEVNNISNSQVTETMFIAMDSVAQLTGNDSYIVVKVNNVDVGDFHANDSTNGVEIKNKHDITFNSGLNTMEVTFYNIRQKGSKYSNVYDGNLNRTIKIYMGNGSAVDCDTVVHNYGYCDICGMLHRYSKVSSHNYVEWSGNVNNVNTTWEFDFYSRKFKKVFNTNTIGTETLETTLELNAGTYSIPYVLNLSGNQYGKFSLLLDNTEVFSKVHNSSINGNVELVIPSTDSYDLVFKWESDNSNVSDGSYVEVDLSKLYYKTYESSYRTPSCTFTRCTKCHDVKTSYGSQLYGSNFYIKTEVTGAQASNTAKFYISFDAVPDGFKDGGAQAGNRYFYPLSVSYQNNKGSSIVRVDTVKRESYMQNIYDDGTMYSDKLHDLTPIGYGGVIEVANGTTTQVSNVPEDAVFSFEESLKDLNGVSITDTISGQKYKMSVSEVSPPNTYYAGAYKITLSKNEVVPTGVDVNMTPYVVITLLVVLPYIAYNKCKVKEDSNN